MKYYAFWMVALALVWCSIPAFGQQVEPEVAAIDAELDEFREGLFTKFNEGKYKEMLEEFCHEDVIASWQDGNTSKGHAEVLKQFDELSKIIERIQVNPTIDERLLLNGGNLVISSGRMGDTYDLKRGETVALDSVWTATLVKSEGKWELVSFSGSANSFDNDVIRLYFGEARNWFAGAAGIIGIIIGLAASFGISRMRSRAG